MEAFAGPGAGDVVGVFGSGRVEGQVVDGSVDGISRGKMDIEGSVGVQGEPQPEQVDDPVVGLVGAP